MTATNAASTLEAYERWASTYPPVAHNPLMRAEQKTMLEALPDVAGRRVLDLACGTGRYAKLLVERGAAEVTALDFSRAMLQQVCVGNRVRASMMLLPFIDAAFDVVICALALGHATHLQQWMSEVSRVLGRGGVLLYSDFHPEAARAGLTRSFRDEHDRGWTVPHNRYDLAGQRSAMAAASLTPDVVREIRVGEDFTEVFPASDAFHRRWAGLPLLLIVRAHK